MWVLPLWLLGMMSLKHLAPSPEYGMLAAAVWPACLLPFAGWLWKFNYRGSVKLENIQWFLLMFWTVFGLIGAVISVDPAKSAPQLVVAIFFWYVGITIWSNGNEKVIKSLGWFPVFALPTMIAMLVFTGAFSLSGRLGDERRLLTWPTPFRN